MLSTKTPRPTPRLYLTLLVLLIAGSIVLAFGLTITPVPALATESRHVAAQHTDTTSTVSPTDVITTHTYLPLVVKDLIDPCAPIPGESYGTLPILSSPTDRPAEEHPDINLAIRGYEITDAYEGLVDYGGPTDSNAPQLTGLCASGCAPPFSNVYQVYDWDWENDRRGSLITVPEVTLVGIDVARGDTVHVPGSGYEIGSGYEVMVLYASTERITLKYTREDNVVWGYTLHVEGICVEPTLLALYEEMNSAGRGSLPALRSGQAFGRARSSEFGVAIRDTGAFMDPRTREDWWHDW
ncbi:MAG: hypothetical protein SVX38_03915 [Chloroflexota bacterium]|nr:hypothetical protein [Chloroflexota bacterium]